MANDLFASVHWIPIDDPALAPVPVPVLRQVVRSARTRASHNEQVLLLRHLAEPFSDSLDK